MENKIEKLQLFFDRIKSLSFWQRLFGWKSLRELSYEAYEEFKSLWGSVDGLSKKSQESSATASLVNSENERLKVDNQKLELTFNHNTSELSRLNSENSDLKASVASKEETIKQLELKTNQQEKDIVLSIQKNENLTAQISILELENSTFRESEKSRVKEHDERMNFHKEETERIRRERTEEKDRIQEVEVQRINGMKLTWAKHEEKTEKIIKAICHKHTIEYCDKVPFGGTPDNTIKICEEYVIFDAKSPATDDLSNFQNYLKNQTNAVKKYIKEEDVKKDVFFVIPSNTFEVISEYCYNMGAYNVYIVTLDALEPIILSLKMIENYEFVEQLTPDERQNICRVIGRFAHLAKRRIQIDCFFSLEFITLLTQCKAELPKEILEKVIEFEMAEKFNPPQERRSKRILTKDLQEDTQKIKREAQAKGIVFPLSISDEIKKLPLNEGDEVK